LINGRIMLRLFIKNSGQEITIKGLNVQNNYQTILYHKLNKLLRNRTVLLRNHIMLADLYRNDAFVNAVDDMWFGYALAGKCEKTQAIFNPHCLVATQKELWLSTIANYANAMVQHQSIKPINVMNLRADYAIVDGHHRTYAAIVTGQPVLAYVYTVAAQWLPY
jgi:hypothetical protein